MALVGARPLRARLTAWWLRRQLVVTPILLLLPAGILFLVFVIYPIVASLTLAFYQWNGFQPRTWIGLANFEELLTDPAFHSALANNFLWLALIWIAPVLGLGIALLVNQALTGMGLVRCLLFLPFVLSQVVVGMIFAWFLNADFGLLNHILAYVGVPAIAPLDDERWAILGVILASLWAQTAYCMMLYLAGLAAIDPAPVDAARLDGAHGWHLLWNIVIPQLRPAHFIVALVCIVSALRSFDLVLVMTRGGPYDSSNVLGLYMYQQTFTNFRYGYGAAIASVQFIIMTSCVAFFLWHMLWRERH